MFHFIKTCRVVAPIVLCLERNTVVTMNSKTKSDMFMRVFNSLAADMVHLESPPHLRIAMLDEVRQVLPFSYDMSSYRHRSFESRQMIVKYLAQGEASIKRPRDSYLEMVYPFSTNPALQDQYQRFNTRSIRLGLLLEDLDTFAGDIAARHAGHEGKAILTANVDRIAWLGSATWGEVALDRDFRVAGMVTWVGRSSMEVQLELSSQLEGEQSGWSFVGFARFVMVARRVALDGPAEIPPLHVGSPLESRLMELGAKRQEERQRRRAASTSGAGFSKDEVTDILSVMEELRNHPALSITHSSPAPGDGISPLPPLPIHRTTLETTCLMHMQDRNNYRRIFGGHLLRLAFEHAFATASVFAGAYCEPAGMGDVLFMAPVPVGSILQLSARVIYTAGHVLHVHVWAVTLQPGLNLVPESAITPELLRLVNPVRTNEFAFIFICRSHPLRSVVPETVVESALYARARRCQKEEWDSFYPAAKAWHVDQGSKAEQQPVSKL